MECKWFAPISKFLLHFRITNSEKLNFELRIALSVVIFISNFVKNNPLVRNLKGEDAQRDVISSISFIKKRN